VLPLNLILNEKTVDGVGVYQLETAMGAAISLFYNARAICVPRTRFLPVKKNQDLLLLWSDSYECDEISILRKREGAADTILELDNSFYGTIDQLASACEHGVPSLFYCDYLKIVGKVRFGKNLSFRGTVKLNSCDDVLLENLEVSG
jgi:hypothetical protein